MHVGVKPSLYVNKLKCFQLGACALAALLSDDAIDSRSASVRQQDSSAPGRCGSRLRIPSNAQVMAQVCVHLTMPHCSDLVTIVENAEYNVQHTALRHQWSSAYAGHLWQREHAIMLDPCSGSTF